MTPVIPSSTSNISIIPGCSFVTRPTDQLIRCCNLRKSTRRTLYAQDCVLPLSTSLRLFPHRRPRFAIASSATGVDVDVNVAVEQADQPDSPVSDEDSSQTSTPPSSADKSVSKQRSRPSRKSEMPPVKDEELVPGATFTGKVRSIQPFGAFIDFGAFTDGLVHVSRLSDSYVKDVSAVVSVGQEVKVKLVEANTETGRISLTMRESEPASGGGGSDKSRPPKRNAQKSNQRRDEGRKTTKFVKGQDLEGTVKNLTRSGAFISLPGGEEGFLPQSEEADEGFGSIMGGSSLEVGQEVKVRVLRIARGQVTLTMKKEEDAKALDSKLQGTVYTATNPFLVAFRKNKDIASFLDEREKEDVTEEVKVDQESQETVETETSSALVVEDEKESVSSEEGEISSLGSNEDEKVKPTSDEDQTPIEDSEVPPSPESVQDEISETAPEEKSEISSSLPVQNENPEAATEETSSITSSNAQEDAPAVEENVIEETPSSEIVVNEVEEATPTAEVDTETPSALEEKGEVSSSLPVPEEKPEPAPEETSSITSSNEEQDALISQENTIEANQIEETTPAVEVDAEIPSAALVEEEKVEAAPEQTDVVADSNGQTIASPSESTTKATISPALVKQLREETGAGMMDCKKALLETEGDYIKAQEYLRKKGLASADKKASRATAEGRIGSYVHDSRIGVLVEVNCETDFVSRGDIFKELVNDLAMQVAACPQVQYLVPEDVPKEIIEKEKAIEMQKEDLLSKPEQIRAKIVEGRINKRLAEFALLEQAYIKDDKVLVKDFVKSTVATVGENIKVKRFVRFNLGEGLEKRSQDFAAEVAAQTQAKPASAAPPKEQQPAPIETAEEAPKAAISAALVKQLREETGAGMMDCKKALSETQGDIEKAQEYLRKKGLSTADKKSSRLAAEGRIGSYIHDSRIGVLIEVNCETDFVGRSEKFKDLVDDLAMQVVACPKVEYVSIEDIPESLVSKEKELEMQREDILSKPENIRGKIVEGRVLKRLGELSLLEQAYLKDDSVLVKDLVKQSVAAIGENIKVRRFVRFTLGESSGSESSESTSES